MTSTSGLSVSDLSVTFGGLRALSNVSFDLAAGRVLGVIGPNGAGKTTMLNAISGFVKPTTGSVMVDGVNVSKRGPEKLSRIGLVRTFQASRAFESLTIEEHFATIVQTDHAEEAWAVITKLRLNQVFHQRPADLPYGMRRDLGLALALAQRPSFLLVDEPSSGLSDAETVRVADLLLEVAATGVGVVVIDHDVRFMRSVATDVIVLNAGVLVASGETSDVLNSDEVRRVYLGA